MKQFIKLGSFLLLFIYGCNSNDEKATADSDALNAGRNFIRAALDGNFARARSFVLPDSVNMEWFGIYERSYNERMKPEDKKGYKEASINVHEVKDLNDSTTLLIYSNSYFKNDTHQLRIVRVNSQWLIDLKSYLENRGDTTIHTDTVPLLPNKPKDQ